MKTILIISFSNLATDPRVNRQIRFLSEHYRVIAAGLADPQVENVQYVPVVMAKKGLPSFRSLFQLLLHRYDPHYWRQAHIIDGFRKLSRVRADLILANDIATLPLALKIRNGARVLFDAHEYAPLQYDDLLLWRLFFKPYASHLCRTHIPHADAVTTVCEGIAEAYQRETILRPAVITNAADYEDYEPMLPQKGKTTIRLVHHGGASPSRKIENMIKMMSYLDDRFELHLILTGSDSRYIRSLRDLAEGRKHIHFSDPVPMRTLPKYLHQFDVGVYLLEPHNFNLRHTLPNKFFEFIQARLAIAIGPSPEMAHIVNEYDLGVVAEDFSPETLARRLSQLDADKVNHYKWQSHKAARILSAEPNKRLLLDLVQRLLGERNEADPQSAKFRSKDGRSKR